MSKEPGKCEVQGCEREAVTVAIVTSTDFVGAANLCKYHYTVAENNAKSLAQGKESKPREKSRIKRKSRKG